MVSRFLKSGVGLAIVTSAVLTTWILVGLDGWSYYRTPLTERAYSEQHALLKPSGPAGQTFGVIGGAMMLMPFLYMLRKKLKAAPLGSLKTWLEVHLFCGIVGPVFVTFHTSFKFNGVVSAAYWSMVAVVLSGVVGRYLYVMIPRTLRGTERTRAEVDAEAQALSGEIMAMRQDDGLGKEIEQFEKALVPRDGTATWTGLLFGELVTGHRIRRFRRHVRHAGLQERERTALTQLTIGRVLLLRRVAYLEKTRAAFTLWHVFHLPLVWVLMVIAAAHVALTVYLGYVPFRWLA